MGWGCISLGERSVFAYEPAGPAWGLPVWSPLEGSGPQDACHSQRLTGPCENCPGWSHRIPQTAQRKGPSHRRPVPQMGGTRRAVRSRGEGVCPGAAAIDGVPPVCPGPRGARLLCVALVIATATPAAPTPGTRPLLPERPPPPGRTGRTSVPGPCARGASAAFSAPHGGPMAPHFQVREQDGGPLRASVFHPHAGAMGAPAPGSHGDQMWRPLCVPGPARGACSAPATRTATLSCPEVGQGPSRRLRLLVPSRLGPAALLPSPVPLRRPWGVLPLHGPCPSSWPGPLCHLGVTS